MTQSSSRVALALVLLVWPKPASAFKVPDALLTLLEAEQKLSTTNAINPLPGASSSSSSQPAFFEDRLLNWLGYWVIVGPTMVTLLLTRYALGALWMEMGAVLVMIFMLGFVVVLEPSGSPEQPQHPGKRYRRETI